MAGIDRVLEALGKRQRRLILLGIYHDHIDSQRDVMMRGSSDPEVDLVHCHLPKLEEAGYIEWDQKTGEISRGPSFEEIEPLLALLENHADELPHGWP